MIIKNNTIKKCPFCGKEPAMSYCSDGLEHIVISCFDCKTTMKELIHFPLRKGYLSNKEVCDYMNKCEERIVNRWNGRVNNDN